MENKNQQGSERWHEDHSVSLGGHFDSPYQDDWRKKLVEPNLKEEEEPRLCWGDAFHVSDDSGPEIRTGQAKLDPAKFPKDACSLAGVGKPPEKSELPIPVRTSLREHYTNWNGLRSAWAEQEVHHASGLPTYMQKIVEGTEEEYEMENLKFCKLAGLKYKTSKQKMKDEIEKIKTQANKMVASMVQQMDKIVDTYKQLEVDK